MIRRGKTDLHVVIFGGENAARLVQHLQVEAPRPKRAYNEELRNEPFSPLGGKPRSNKQSLQKSWRGVSLTWQACWRNCRRAPATSVGIE
jgi:hypothetical protein